MFEKSLQDLVKGIRSHKRDPSAFISQAIQEIKQELRSVDPFVKAQVCGLVGGTCRLIMVDYMACVWSVRSGVNFLRRFKPSRPLAH